MSPRIGEGAGPAQVVSPSVNLYAKADERGELETQLLFGERFDIIKEQDGWALGKCLSDGYSGYVRSEGLSRTIFSPTHRVRTASTLVYQTASAKGVMKNRLGMGACLRVKKEEEGFCEIATGGFVFGDHLAPITAAQKDTRKDTRKDFVAVAESLMGVPYLWGGRDSTIGIDCSALLQLALQLAGGEGGIKAPRNSGEQEAQLGEAISPPLQRGDLIFWKAHIGIMLDNTTLLHANAFHMCVAKEKLADARPRIKKVAGDIRAIKRL